MPNKLIFLALAATIAIGCPQIALGSTIDLDAYADAIFKAEGGYKATYLYGIRSIKYKDETEARQICKNTVFNTLVKYRSTRCKPGEADIDCLARRYCPINSDTDNGTCKYWKDNVIGGKEYRSLNQSGGRGVDVD